MSRILTCYHKQRKCKCDWNCVKRRIRKFCTRHITQKKGVTAGLVKIGTDYQKSAEKTKKKLIANQSAKMY